MKFDSEFIALILTTVMPTLRITRNEVLFRTPLSLISHIFAQIASQNGARIERPINYKKAMEELSNGKSTS